MPRKAVSGTDLWQAMNPAVNAATFYHEPAGEAHPALRLLRTDFDLWYILSGAGEVRNDGQWQSFVAGDLVVMAPGGHYEQMRAGPDGPCQLYGVHLSPFGVPEARRDAALAALLPPRLSLLHRPAVPGFFKQLFRAYTTQQGQSSLAVKGWALQILDVLREELARGHDGPPAQTHPGLLLAIRYLERNYAERVTLQRLSEVSGLSPHHLCTLFGRRFGLPPVEYLIEVRLREAKQLLARGVGVRDTAERVGLSSQHYFSRLFRARTGQTPSAFQREHLHL